MVPCVSFGERDLCVEQAVTEHGTTRKVIFVVLAGA